MAGPTIFQRIAAYAREHGLEFHAAAAQMGRRAAARRSGRRRQAARGREVYERTCARLGERE